MAIKTGGKAIIIALVVGVVGVGLWKSGMMDSAEQSATNPPRNAEVEVSTSRPSKQQKEEPKSSRLGAVDTTLQSILDNGVIKIVAQSPSKPFFYIEGGQARGFNMEFLRIMLAQPAFGGKIMIDSNFTVDSYQDVPEALLKTTNGKPSVDIAIDGLTFSDSDLPGVVYSIPYIDNFGYSLITSPTSFIKQGDDLSGLTIGLLKGDPDVLRYAKGAFPKATFVELNDESVANSGRDWINRFIKEGRVDGIIYDYPFGASEIEGTNLQFAVTKLPGSDIRYKIGVRKDDVKLLDAVNTSIRKAKEDPEYQNLIVKYFAAKNTIAVKKKESNEGTYTVKRGDTLSTIAAAKLGDSSRYREIESRNNLPNPNLISVGQVLIISGT